MPNTFQSVSTGTDDYRRFLAATGSVLHGGEVIAHSLQTVKDIIQILNFGYWSQSAHGKTDSLTQNRSFTNTGISYSKFTIFFLKSFQALVYIADITCVLSNNMGFVILFKYFVEVVSNYYTAVYRFGIFSNDWCDLFNISSFPFGLRVKV